MVFPPVAAATPKNSGENSGRPKQKRQQYHIVYGNPDLKVVVRLLPPLLTQDQFLLQLENKGVFASGNRPYTNFYYEPGSRDVKAFEEPVFSRAYFQFPTKQLAETYMNELNNLSFEEADTGDHFMCQTMRSIFGAVANALDAPPLEDFASDPLFSAFLQAREERRNVNIMDVKKGLEAEEKRRKLALKQKEKQKDMKKKQKLKKKEQSDKNGDKPNESEAAGNNDAKKKKRPKNNKINGGSGGGGTAIEGVSGGSPAPTGGNKKNTKPPGARVNNAVQTNSSGQSNQNNPNAAKKKKKKAKKTETEDQNTNGPDGSGGPKKKEGVKQRKKPKEKKDNIQTDKTEKSDKKDNIDKGPNPTTS